MADRARPVQGPRARSTCSATASCCDGGGGATRARARRRSGSGRAAPSCSRTRPVAGSRSWIRCGAAGFWAGLPAALLRPAGLTVTDSGVRAAAARLGGSEVGAGAAGRDRRPRRAVVRPRRRMGGGPGALGPGHGPSERGGAQPDRLPAALRGARVRGAPLRERPAARHRLRHEAVAPRLRPARRRARRHRPRADPARAREHRHRQRRLRTCRSRTGARTRSCSPRCSSTSSGPATRWRSAAGCCGPAAT